MTHVNTFLDYPSTGRTFEMTWMQIVRVEDDKLVESWWEMDIELFRKRLSGEA